MTLEELAAETLVEKNRRLRQVKCAHTDRYRSTVLGPSGEHVTEFCWDCGKSWNYSVGQFNVREREMTDEGVMSVIDDAAALFREVMVAHLTRQAVDGVIPCAQIEMLADQHHMAFRRLLTERADKRTRKSDG